ncbi:WD40/YVTN/BNR-like repeat-containing protein [Pleionea sediminis]|uniref:WD40/YVTN/BNR-like repeat-containing protein n=1 Tax=Pleionea sediminis TaxID=2569479 RepID=UPI0011863967|nr:YCF48-related protein [Pleionea sediminis]
MIHSLKLLLLLSLTLFSMAHAAQSIEAQKADKSLLLDIAKLPEDKLVAVGERGHVLLSDNQGKSWRQVITPTRSTLTAVTFVDDKIGFAVGHQQVIIKTADGGETWELQFENSEDIYYPALFDVWFSDAEKGIAVGAYGLYLSTNDGGENWEFVDQESLGDPDFGLPHFYSLDYDSKKNRLYMAGELGFLAVSEDLGENWESLESPYEGSFFNVGVTPSGSLQVMGLRGHLFRSADDGESWEEIETNSIASINNMLSIGGSQLAYFSVDGVMLFSNDDGMSVKSVQTVDRNGLMNGVKTGINTLVVVGAKGIDRFDMSGQKIIQ